MLVRDLRSLLGSQVREAARKTGELAERAGLHWTYVSGIERGRRNPGLNTLNTLAAALRLSLADLLKDLDKV